MVPIILSLALAGPVAPSAEVTHLARCQSAERALEDLTSSGLEVPVAWRSPEHVVDTFHSKRSGGRIHKATDIMAPRGTPIFAIEDGVVTGVRVNRLGGNVIEQVDATGCVGFYYAHLDRYADDIVPGAVGGGATCSATSAPPATPMAPPTCTSACISLARVRACSRGTTP
jgi:hypothetical protein